MVKVTSHHRKERISFDVIPDFHLPGVVEPWVCFLQTLTSWVLAVLLEHASTLCKYFVKPYLFRRWEREWERYWFRNILILHFDFATHGIPFQTLQMAPPQNPSGKRQEMALVLDPRGSFNVISICISYVYLMSVFVWFVWFVCE